MKTNINRLLENSARSDVIGYNIYTMGRNIPCINIPEDREFGYNIASHWDKPNLGLHGIIAIGHELNIKDLITLEIYEEDKKLDFTAVRNHWTPSYMKTYYRSAADTEYYPRTGCLCVYEEKCFLPDDTFVSRIKLFNDKREDCTFTVKLKLPVERKSEGEYFLNAKTVPRSLKREYFVTGYICALNNEHKDTFTVTVPAGGEAEFKYGMAFETDSFESAYKRLDAAFEINSPLEVKEKHFNNWMDENVPLLKTNNTDMLKVYYYRNFLIYHAIHSPDLIIKDHEFDGECVYESPFGGWFGAPVGLPIPMQIEEMKWMKNPQAVRSHIKNWTKAVGATHGYIQYTPFAIWHLYLHYPNDEFLSLCYDSCKAFTLRSYDTAHPEKLPISVGSWRTGAEYQPSFYQYTTPAWDWRHDNEGARDGFEMAAVYRVEECVMLAANLLACGNIADKLGKKDESKTFHSLFKTVKEQIIKRFWNKDHKFFFDCEPENNKQCDLAGVYDGFSPLMWDLAGGEFDDIFDKLVDFKHFKSNFPVPSASKSCPMYWFDNCITGPCASSVKEPKTYGACWNGPSWPFANTLVLEALGAASKRNDTLKELWIDFFSKYTEMHFLYSDRSVPAIVEHYRATDGAPFSMFNDYFHSEWITMFMEFWAGITVNEDGVSFDPSTDDEFILENVKIADKYYTFEQHIENGKTVRTFNIAKP